MSEGKRAVWRHEVGIDGPVTISLTSHPVAVAALSGEDGIEFWAESYPGFPGVPRTFAVFGTGHPLPHGAKYVGTAPRTPHGLVWHLYELRADVDL